MNNLLLKIAGGLFLGAGAVFATPRGREKAKEVSDSGKIILVANSLKGEPYVWGGATPETGMDCSGFIQYVITKATGLLVPRLITEQALEAPYSINIAGAPYSEVIKLLKPGDAIGLNYDQSGRYDHGGFYEGFGNVIHSSGGQNCPQSSLPCKVIRAKLSRWSNAWTTIYAYHRKPNHD